MTDTNNIREILCKAIEQKKKIAFTRKTSEVDGVMLLAYCVGNPHILYKATSDNVLVDMWTITGESKSGNLPGWRRYKLEDITSVIVCNENFELEDSFNINNERHVEIYSVSNRVDFG